MLKKTKINQKIKNVKFCFLIQQQAFFLNLLQVESFTFFVFYL